MLHNRAVLRVLGCLPEVQCVHAPEVGVLDIDSHETVRGDAGPSRIFLFLLVGGPGQIPVRYPVSEAVHDLLVLLRGRVAFLPCTCDAEFQVVVIFLVNAEAAERNVAAIIGIPDDFSQSHCELVPVERRNNLSQDRIGDVILRAL